MSIINNAQKGKASQPEGEPREPQNFDPEELIPSDVSPLTISDRAARRSAELRNGFYYQAIETTLLRGGITLLHQGPSVDFPEGFHIKRRPGGAFIFRVPSVQNYGDLQVFVARLLGHTELHLPPAKIANCKRDVCLRLPSDAAEAGRIRNQAALFAEHFLLPDDALRALTDEFGGDVREMAFQLGLSGDFVRARLSVAAPAP